jgi:predicted outer membrane repeat protein
MGCEYKRYDTILKKERQILRCRFPSLHFSLIFQYGALCFDGGTFLVFESNTFIDNSAVNYYSYSAGVYIDYSTVFINGNLFLRSKAYKGAALYFEDSHVEAFCNKFEGNQVSYSGGAIFSTDSSLDAKYNQFINNTATGIFNPSSAVNQVSSFGGAIYSEDSSLDAKFNQFINNTATEGSGGAICSYYSQLYFTSNNFSFNTADYGGAVLGKVSGIVTNADSFTKNAATVSFILHFNQIEICHFIEAFI